MRTVIIALPVPDDTDIFDVADTINEAIERPFEWDGWDCVVYENAEALADDLGWSTT